MSQPSPSPSPEVVTVRLPSGRLRYLFEAYHEECGHCRTGTRTVSVWVSARGHGESIAWCRHCFNATCRPTRLQAEYRPQLAAVVAAAASGGSSPYPAVRPALEDLERRGLL